MGGVTGVWRRIPLPPPSLAPSQQSRPCSWPSKKKRGCPMPHPWALLSSLPPASKRSSSPPPAQKQPVVTREADTRRPLTERFEVPLPHSAARTSAHHTHIPFAPHAVRSIGALDGPSSAPEGRGRGGGANPMMRGWAEWTKPCGRARDVLCRSLFWLLLPTRWCVPTEGPGKSKRKGPVTGQTRLASFCLGNGRSLWGRRGGSNGWRRRNIVS